MIDNQELRSLRIHLNAEKILNARKESKVLTDQESQGIRGDNLVTYNSGVTSYEETFYPVFNRSLKSFLAQRLDLGKSRFVLDCMGQGQVLRELSIQAGLAVSLADIRSKDQIKQDSQKNIGIICSDIMSKKTWNKIREEMSILNIDGFDLVLCRPVGGMQSIAVIQNLYYELVNNLWHLTTQDQGLILTEIPYFARNGGYINKWLQNVEKSGIEYECAEKVFRLVRKFDSPIDLPRLKYVLN